MEKKDRLISNIRLKSQKITQSELNNASELVSYMGALQAQDYAMAKWAIGVRLQEPSLEKIESALDKGEIIRTHILRPTWHFVCAEDIYWMLDLTAPRIKASMKSRHNQLELTGSLLSKTSELIENALYGGNSLTRNELKEEFTHAGIRTDENRLSHILFMAELDGIICSGPLKNEKQTYSLLQYRVPVRKKLSRDESLAELAKRYFASRCPATIHDFAWWSNLNLTEIRKTVDLIKSDFYTETIGSGQYLFPQSLSGDGKAKNSTHLLPSYDEYLISYRDRSSSLSVINNKKTVSVNGIFFPTIVLNGQVAGLWQRKIKNGKVTIETNLFQPLSKTETSQVEKQVLKFGRFADKESELKT